LITVVVDGDVDEAVEDGFIDAGGHDDDDKRTGVSFPLLLVSL